MRHHRARLPKKTSGFSWGRVVRVDGTITYRLFRRDQRGAIHVAMLVFTRDDSRGDMAKDINRKRHTLRDQVDEIDLKLMGVTQ